MDGERLRELAAAARRVVTDAKSGGGQWKEELRGVLLALLGPQNEPDPDLRRHVPVALIGVAHDALLNARTFGFDPNPNVRAVATHMETLAPILEQAAERAEAVNRPAAPVPAREADLPDRFGRWVPSKRLGQGGQGQVYLVFDPETGEQGALKVVRQDRADEDSRYRVRFEREGAILSKLRHPNVARVLDWNPRDGWLVTEWAPLGTLHDNREAYEADVWRTLRVARDIAAGLRAAHRKDIIHRDLKPGNVVLRSLDHAMVVDFGIAHRPNDNPLTTLGHPIVSTWFSPPEAEITGHEPTPAYDVYSLGKIIHWLLCGGKQTFLREEFDVSDANLVVRFGRPELAAVNTMLGKMIAEDAAGRFSAMDDVIRAIDGMLAPSWAGVLATGDGAGRPEPPPSQPRAVESRDSPDPVEEELKRRQLQQLRNETALLPLLQQHGGLSGGPDYAEAQFDLINQGRHPIQVPQVRVEARFNQAFRQHVERLGVPAPAQLPRFTPPIKKPPTAVQPQERYRFKLKITADQARAALAKAGFDVGKAFDRNWLSGELVVVCRDAFGEEVKVTGAFGLPR